MTARGFHKIFVWVGCPIAAERACDLAAGVAKPGVDVTIGLPVDHGDPGAVARLARPLADRHVDVRIVALPDRRSRTLAAAARARAHDLVIHADVDRPCTPVDSDLADLCGCPVWTVRVPSTSPDPSGAPDPSGMNHAA